MDSQAIRQWIGRTETRDDIVTPAPLAMMAATLDFPAHSVSTEVRLLWHWLYFLPLGRLCEAGADGHPRRGGFLPPIDLPRRMWAGSRFHFHHALKVGDAIQRSSSITDIRHKQGRSGELVFVTVRHVISNALGTAIEEEHDIVYRALPAPDAPPVRAAIPYQAQFSRRVRPDAILLFRYSALTFNSHRIHYDYPYVVNEEGYPDLVVHGPLCATLLIEEVQMRFPDQRVRTFEFQAFSPLFANQEFGIGGRRDGDTVHVWTVTPEGYLGMLATVELA